MRPGDEVLEWNGRSLQGKTYEEVYDIIAESKQEAQVELIVSRYMRSRPMSVVTPSSSSTAAAALGHFPGEAPGSLEEAAAFAAAASSSMHHHHHHGHHHISSSPSSHHHHHHHQDPLQQHHHRSGGSSHPSQPPPILRRHTDLSIQVPSSSFASQHGETSASVMARQSSLGAQVGARTRVRVSRSSTISGRIQVNHPAATQSCASRLNLRLLTSFFFLLSLPGQALVRHSVLAARGDGLECRRAAAPWLRSA